MSLPRIPADPMWAQYLQDGEYLIWHGRPNSDYLISRDSAVIALVGFACLGLSGFIFFKSWLSILNQATWMYSVVFLFLAGPWMAFAHHFVGRRRRRKTWYSLTNRRAFIGTDLGKKELSHYPIDNPELPRLIHGGLMGRDCVMFARQTIRSINTDQMGSVKDIGFEMIDGADQVYHLIKRIQGGET